MRASLPLEPGERVIAAARDRGGGWVVATERALLAGDRRTPWTDVVHAQWYDEQQLLAVDLVARRRAVDARSRSPIPAGCPRPCTSG